MPKKIAQDLRDHLFFTRRLSQALYKDVPPGELDVARLVEDKPCFQSTQPANLPEKKILVLTDYRFNCEFGPGMNRLSFLAKTRIKSAMQWMEILMQEGFKIYVYQNEYTPILMENPEFMKDFLGTYEYTKHITPASIQRVLPGLRSCEKRDIQADQVLLLDPHQFYQFEAGCILSPAYVRLSDLAHFPSHARKVISLHNSLPSGLCLLMDAEDRETRHQQAKVLSLLGSGIEVTETITHLECPPDALLSSLFDHLDLSAVTSLVIDLTRTSQFGMIFSLLQQTPNLCKLQIKGPPPIGGALRAEGLASIAPLEHVTALELYEIESGNIEFDALKALCAILPNLNELTLASSASRFRVTGLEKSKHHLEVGFDQSTIAETGAGASSSEKEPSTDTLKKRFRLSVGHPLMIAFNKISEFDWSSYVGNFQFHLGDGIERIVPNLQTDPAHQARSVATINELWPTLKTIVLPFKNISLERGPDQRVPQREWFMAVEDGEYGEGDAHDDVVDTSPHPADTDDASPKTKKLRMTALDDDKTEQVSTQKQNKNKAEQQSVIRMMRQGSRMTRNNLTYSAEYDATTLPPTLSCEEYFLSTVVDIPNPNPRQYRINIFDTVEEHDGKISLSKTSKHLTSFSPPQMLGNLYLWARNQLNPRLFFGSYSFFLSNDWESIPSLSAREGLKAYQILIDGTPTDLGEQIEFATLHQITYCRTRGPSAFVTINYVVHVPEVVDPLAFYDNLPMVLQSIIKKSHQFTQFQSLNVEGETAYLEALFEQGVGVCRHRAAAAKYKIDQTVKKLAESGPLYYQVDTFVVTNAVHQFLEIHLSSVDGATLSFTMDLGGGDATLTTKALPIPDLTEHPQPEEAITEDLKAATATSSSISYTIPDYISHILSEESKTLLIQTTSSEALSGLRDALHAQYMERGVAVYRVSHADDLICSAPRLVKINEHKGERLRPPCGPLVDFLRTYPNGAILVDYSALDVNTIVEFNSMYDKTRVVDGYPVPSGIVIIGLQNKHAPNAYLYPDFVERFSARKLCEIPAAEWIAHSKKPIILNKPEGLDTFDIDFFNQSNWKSILYGTWSLQGKDYFFKPGLLEQALASKLPILLKNAPWDDANFVHVWENHDIALYRTEGYDWKMILDGVHLGSNEEAAFEILNPTRYFMFFNQYNCDNIKRELHCKFGLLESYSGQILTLHVTRALSEDQWAHLLTAAKKYNVSLYINCFVAVSLPQSMQDILLPSSSMALLQQGSEIYISADVEAALATRLSEKAKTAILSIDISGHVFSDLFDYLKKEPSIDFYDFHEEKACVQKALEAGGTVLLKGHFSEEFVDQLHKYMFASAFQKQLIIVADSDKYFRGMVHETILASREEKKALFPEAMIGGLRDDFFDNSLARLRTMIAYRQINPENDPNDAFIGLDSLPPQPLHEKMADDCSAEVVASLFIEHRVNALKRAFMVSPIAYLTGLTGVGKSSFIAQYAASIQDGPCFMGEDNFELWLRQGGLFVIDEANMRFTDYSHFENCRAEQPFIIHQGEKVDLNPIGSDTKPAHLLLLIINPSGYGGDRNSPKLLVNHGNAVVFQPMPIEFIDESILKPLLKGTALDDKPKINADILNAYQFLCRYSRDQILVTPRELKSISLLSLAYLERNRRVNPEQVVRHYIKVIMRPLAPAEALGAFDELFMPYPVIPSLLKSMRIPTTFTMTQSREKIAETLLSFIEVRRYEQSHWSASLSGALKLVILDGEPGMGKSELVNTVLSLSKTPFVKIPITYSFEEKASILKHAFHEGLCVWIDEINASPMMERYINELLDTKPNVLMGDKPGFFIIGTQNPDLPGRLGASDAQARRGLKLKVRNYSYQEMQRILEKQGFNPTELYNLLKEYNGRNVRIIFQKATALLESKIKRWDISAEQWTHAIHKIRRGLLFYRAHSKKMVKNIAADMAIMSREPLDTMDDDEPSAEFTSAKAIKSEVNVNVLELLGLIKRINQDCNYYLILDLTRHSSPEEISAACHEWLFLMDPSIRDMFYSNAELPSYLSPQQWDDIAQYLPGFMKKIINTLSNAEEKEKYDQELAQSLLDFPKSIETITAPQTVTSADELWTLVTKALNETYSTYEPMKVVFGERWKADEYVIYYDNKRGGLFHLSYDDRFLIDRFLNVPIPKQFVVEHSAFPTLTAWCIKEAKLNSYYSRNAAIMNEIATILGAKIWPCEMFFDLMTNLCSSPENQGFLDKIQNKATRNGLSLMGEIFKLIEQSPRHDLLASRLLLILCKNAKYQTELLNYLPFLAKVMLPRSKAMSQNETRENILRILGLLIQANFTPGKQFGVYDSHLRELCKQLIDEARFLEIEPEKHHIDLKMRVAICSLVLFNKILPIQGLKWLKETALIYHATGDLVNLGRCSKENEKLFTHFHGLQLISRTKHSFEPFERFTQQWVEHCNKTMLNKSSLTQMVSDFVQKMRGAIEPSPSPIEQAASGIGGGSSGLFHHSATAARNTANAGAGDGLFL